MQNTENFNLKVYEGEDLFNPLTVENVNVQAIDTQMKKNENHAVGDATELVSGTVHAITRLTPDAPMLRFTATSRFTAGDTFTVDGVQVSALTVSGEQLPDGAYIIGSEVLAYLKGTLLTVFTSQGTLATAKNALKLGGNDPEYYATASAVQTAQETATAAGNLANEVNQSLDKLNSNLGSMDVIGSFRSNGQSVSIDYSKYRTIYVCMRINEFKTSVCDLNIPVKAITDHVFYAANTHAYINEEYKASFEIRFSDSSISLEAYFCYGWSFTDITVLGIK